MEEMGFEYELEILPFPPRIFQRDYLDVNSLGTVPFFVDGDTEMTESVGICQYLADRYDSERNCSIAPDHPEYGDYLNWLHHADATLTFPQTLVLRYRYLEQDPAKHAVAEDYAKWFQARLKRLTSHLETRDYLVDGRFTMADIAIAYALHLAAVLKLDGAYSPAVRCYLERLRSRPAFGRADERAGPLVVPGMGQ